MNPMPYQPMGRPAGPTGTPRSGGPTGGLSETKKWGDTSSKLNEISRIFVGSVEYKSTSCDEIEQRFQKYGSIHGIDLNQKNFVFIQFNTVEEAQNACSAENGSYFKGKKIEVRAFNKSGHPTKGRHTGPTGAHNRDRSRSPNRAMGGPTGRLMGGPTGTRHGSVLPTSYDPYPPYGGGGGVGGPPPIPPQPVVEPGNEAEIIVVDRAQWRYAEMMEQRIKSETGIRYIDMLFLHTPSSLNMTLNDLFERQTAYALVVTPVNEEHRSITLHVLHNQTEHRNMPLEDAILLIRKDFEALTGRPGPPVPYVAPTERAYSAGDAAIDTRIPEAVSYLLRTILAEKGTQFLSPTQLDLLIDWLQNEKSKLGPKGGPHSGGGPSSQSTGHSAELAKHRSNLLDNPHVQAALSSLIQIGALGSANGSNSDTNLSNNGMSVTNSNSFGGQQNAVNSRRHPLMGTELSGGHSQASIPGAPGGLVEYPPPQSYNHYNYQY